MRVKFFGLEYIEVRAKYLLREQLLLDWLSNLPLDLSSIIARCKGEGHNQIECVD